MPPFEADETLSTSGFLADARPVACIFSQADVVSWLAAFAFPSSWIRRPAARKALDAHLHSVAHCALVMKTTLKFHLRLRPYKGSVTTVQVQMPFHAVGRSFPSYAPGSIYLLARGRDVRNYLLFYRLMSSPKQSFCMIRVVYSEHAALEYCYAKLCYYKCACTIFSANVEYI